MKLSLICVYKTLNLTQLLKVQSSEWDNQSIKELLGIEHRLIHHISLTLGPKIQHHWPVETTFFCRYLKKKKENVRTWSTHNKHKEGEQPGTHRILLFLWPLWRRNTHHVRQQKCAAEQTQRLPCSLSNFNNCFCRDKPQSLIIHWKVQGQHFSLPLYTVAHQSKV